MDKTDSLKTRPRNGGPISLLLTAILVLLPVVPLRAALTQTDASDHSVAYHGTWVADTRSATRHVTNTADDSASYAFTGSTIKWIGTRGSDRGMTDVFIDAVHQGTVDAYDAANLSGQLLFERTGLGSGNHTIKLVCLRKKNPLSSGFYIDLDAFAWGAADEFGWELHTADTHLSLSVRANQPVISQLKNPAVGWNWTPVDAPLPLPGRVTVDGVARAPDWTYAGAVAVYSKGLQVTLTFTSTTPRLSLSQVWTAWPGVGPVEESTAITNNTGGDVTYRHAEVVACDLTISADNPVTLTRFSRSSVRVDKLDSFFNRGVLREVVSRGSDIQSTVGNDFVPSDFVLPFAILDSGGKHGIYFGYTWDFGRFSNSARDDDRRIRTRFYLGDTGSVTTAAGKVFKVPGMFFGAYQGDIDDGSNAMKRWFWSCKIPPTLRATPNEPLTEYSVAHYSEAELKAFLAANPLGEWGVELLKEDAWWTVDVDTDAYFGWSWDPDPKKWPNGMTLGDTTHALGMQLSLYLGNQYAHNDIATQAGRDRQKAALLKRYDQWHYDYWRSDMMFEYPNDYLSHEGFLEILDALIAARGGETGSFRWENCSGGGSKKSFDLLQRQTVMTTEDSGGSLGTVENFRKAFYANSYMINPVQLKGDNIENESSPVRAYYQMRSSMMGAWMYGSFDTTVIQPVIYRELLAQYKTKQRPIIRGGNTYHILPMPDGINWDGMEFFNPALNKGSIFLFHPASDAPAARTIFLKGLIDDGVTSYALTFQDRTEQNVTRTGTYLMHTGLTVNGLSGALASEIIWIN